MDKNILQITREELLEGKTKEEKLHFEKNFYATWESDLITGGIVELFLEVKHNHRYTRFYEGHIDLAVIYINRILRKEELEEPSHYNSKEEELEDLINDYENIGFKRQHDKNVVYYRIQDLKRDIKNEKEEKKNESNKKI